MYMYMTGYTLLSTGYDRIYCLINAASCICILQDILSYQQDMTGYTVLWMRHHVYVYDRIYFLINRIWQDILSYQCGIMYMYITGYTLLSTGYDRIYCLMNAASSTHIHIQRLPLIRHVTGASWFKSVYNSLGSLVFWEHRSRVLYYTNMWMGLDVYICLLRGSFLQWV